MLKTMRTGNAEDRVLLRHEDLVKCGDLAGGLLTDSMRPHCRFRWVAIRVWVTRMWRASLAAVYFAFNWLVYKLDYARSFRWACRLLTLLYLAVQEAWESRWFRALQSVGVYPDHLNCMHMPHSGGSSLSV